MLSLLYIKNLAIIHGLNFSFANGLNRVIGKAKTDLTQWQTKELLRING